MLKYTIFLFALVFVFLTGLAKSDVRLKDNVKPIRDYMNLTTCEWDWNYVAEEVFNLTGHSSGFMAEEVKEVYPLCTYKDNLYAEYLMVDYRCLFHIWEIMD